jgi:hypothetical protein
MWKVLSDRLSDKVHFGFIKDEKAEAREALGIPTKDKKVDGVKVVTWSVDGEKHVYSGRSRSLCTVLEKKREDPDRFTVILTARSRSS